MSAQIESEDVDAVSVLNTGESASKDKKTSMDDLRALATGTKAGFRVVLHMRVRTHTRGEVAESSTEDINLQDLPYEIPDNEHANRKPDEDAGVP